MKEKNSQKNNAISIVFEFLNGSYDSIYDFCVENNMDREIFDNYLNIIKNEMPNLYREYLKNSEEKDINHYNEEDEKLLKIIYHIVNGVKEENENIRKYEYLDFCLESKKMSITKFLKEVNDRFKLNYDSKRAIKSFGVQNKERHKFKIEDILKEKYFITINDKVKEVSEDEKIEILSIINDLKLPKEIKIYKQLTRRFLSGNFNFSDEISKRK